jgi:hypothetical protein
VASMDTARNHGFVCAVVKAHSWQTKNIMYHRP